jgi:hypothetical protein
MTPAQADRLARALRRIADAIEHSRAKPRALDVQRERLRVLARGEKSNGHWHAQFVRMARADFATWQKQSDPDLLATVRGFAMLLHDAPEEVDPWQPAPEDVDDLRRVARACGPRSGALVVLAYLAFRTGTLGGTRYARGHVPPQRVRQRADSFARVAKRERKK